MKLRFSQILLLAAGLGLAVLLVMLFTGQKTWFSTQPPIEIQPNLDHQFKAIPQSPNSFFADGKSLREPVAGTVDTSASLPYPLGAGDIDAAETANVPSAEIVGYRTSDLFLARGQNRYNVFCSPCHGYDGYSPNSKVSQKGWAGIPVLALSDSAKNAGVEAPNATQLSDARIYHIISAGQGIMPKYSDKIDPIDRWAIINYLRTKLQGIGAVASKPIAAAPAAKN